MQTGRRKKRKKRMTDGSSFSMTGSRRAIAFRDHLNDREEEAVRQLVDACNQADGTRYSYPLDGDIYLLRYDEGSDDPEERLLGLLCIWHLGSTKDGEELSEAAAFTAPDHRRQGIFSELYETARPVLSPSVLFSIYKNEPAERALSSIGGYYDHSEYLMKLSLAERSFDAEAGLSFYDEGESFHAEAAYGEANYRLNGDGSAYIYGVLVYESRRGKGYGYKLLCGLLNRLKEMGMTEAMLEVFSENTPALYLYQKLGFTIAERIDYGFACGRRENMV